MNGFILPPILRPAGRRYFLLLLPSIDGEIEQPVTIVHRLDPAARRPICFEDVGTPAQIADEVHAADLAAGQQYVARGEDRIPWHIPPPEIEVQRALVIGALAKFRIGQDRKNGG